MYKIAAMGEYESICGLGALGIKTYPVEGRETGIEVLETLRKESFAVIYMTEYLYESLKEEIEITSGALIPAIIPIPGMMESSGTGLTRVKKWVEKAVGSDIIFKDEN